MAKQTYSGDAIRGLTGDYSWPDGTLRIVFKPVGGGFGFDVRFLPGPTGRCEVTQERCDKIAELMGAWASLVQQASREGLS